MRDKSRYWDKEWLHQQYIVDDKGITTIAKEFDLNYSCLYDSIKRFGIPIKNRAKLFISNTDAVKFLGDKEWLQEEYITKKRSLSDIARQFKINKWTVDNWLKKHGIFKRTWQESNFHTNGNVNLLNDKDWLVEQYVNADRTADSIGKELNINLNSIIRGLRKHGIPIRQIIGAPYPISDPEWLCDQYEIKGKSITQIERETKSTHRTIRNAILALGIPIRPYCKYAGIASSLHLHSFIPLIEGIGIKHETSHIVDLKQEVNRIYEIDEYLPELGILLDLHGDYWHNLPERKERDVIKARNLSVYRPHLRYVVIWEHQIHNGEALKILQSLLGNQVL